MYYKRCDCGRQRWGRCGHPWWAKSKRLDPLRQSLGTGDRAAAEVEFARLLVDAADTPRPRPGVHRLSEYAAADIARARDEGTTDAWIATLEGSYWASVLAHFGVDFDMSELTTQALREYAGRRRLAGYRGQTIRRELQCLKRAVAIGQERGWLRHPPCAFPRVRGSPPKDSQRGHYVAPEVIRAWFAQLDARARPAIAFSVLTGLRAFELRRVSSAWIERLPGGAFLRVPAAAAKDREERLVPLSPMAAAILETVGSFGTICHRRTMTGAARRAKISRAPTLRDLRHTFATIAEQTDRKATQDALGHASERITSRYLHSTELRLSAVGGAVQDVLGSFLGGTAEGAQQIAKSGVSTGGRRGFRTHDIQLVRPETSSNHAESRSLEWNRVDVDPPSSAESGAQAGGTGK